MVAVLGTFALALPTPSRAESQSEWLERQLQMTDGYAPPPVLAVAVQNRHVVAAAPAIRRSPPRAVAPAKSVPRPKRVAQRPAKRTAALKTPVPPAAPAASDPPPPTPVECADCGVIEPFRETDAHREDIGLAALGALLLLAAFKVAKVAGALQHG
jgi:hypothetical protein